MSPTSRPIEPLASIRTEPPGARRPSPPVELLLQPACDLSGATLRRLLVGPEPGDRPVGQLDGVTECLLALGIRLGEDGADGGLLARERGRDQREARLTGG